MTSLGRIPRHVTILTAYIAVLVFNYLTIFATTYPVMLFIRVMTAMLCGLTLSLAIAATSEHMSASRRAGAVAWIIGGFSIANVLAFPSERRSAKWQDGKRLSLLHHWLESSR